MYVFAFSITRKLVKTNSDLYTLKEKSYFNTNIDENEG